MWPHALCPSPGMVAQVVKEWSPRRLSHARSSSCASCGILQCKEWMLYFTVLVRPVVGRICPHESPWGGAAFLLAGFGVLGMGRSGNGISNGL